MDVTLYYIEFVGNGLGVWESHWYTTREQAEQGHAKMVEMNFIPITDDQATGEPQQLLPVKERRVSMTPEGIVELADRLGNPLAR